MAASGASHRVVRALKIFSWGCPSLGSASKAKHEALDSVCESALELGDIAPAHSNLTAEQQEQQAQDAATDAPIDDEHRHDPGALDWDEVTREDAPNEPDADLDELATARQSCAQASASTGLRQLASGLAFMLVLIMYQTMPLILEGEDAQTVVARLSTDGGKIPGAFGVDQHWCPVVLQLLGYGAHRGASGLSRVLHRFLAALSPDRALIVRVWKGSDCATQLAANFVGYFAQILQLIRDGLGNVRLLMYIPPFLWGGCYAVVNEQEVEQAVGEIYKNGAGQARWRPGADGWTTYSRSDGTGSHVGPGTSWRVPTIVKVPTSALLYAITNVALFIRFNLGFDGGTLFSLTGTSPSSAQPDPFTETAKAAMQKIYIYVRLPRGMTVADYEAAFGDATCRSRLDEIEHTNHPANNRKQQGITQLPKLKESLDSAGGGADPAYEQRRSAYVAANGDEDDDFAPMQPERDCFDESEINDIMERNKWTKLAHDFVPPPGRHGALRCDDSFSRDVLIRVPIVIKPYSRQLTDAIFDVSTMAILQLMVLCLVHFRMRTLECFLNLVNAPFRALMKEQKHVRAIENNYNKPIKEKLGSKHTVYQTKSGDVPCATSNGPNAGIFQGDFLKLRGFDLSQEGLRTGEIAYPSEYLQALQQTFLAVGNASFVRHTLPRIAACALDWAIAMELGFKAEMSDEDVRLFELHLRRHTYALAELFQGGLCWYYFQGLKVLIEQAKETRSLLINSQQCVEHSMQTVRQTVRHTVHGGVGAPKKGMDRAEDLAAKRARAPSEHKALWRNLLFHSMSAVRTFSEKAPEVSRMTFMGVWSLLCEKIAEGRSMVWPTLNWQWRFCRAMIHIYGKLCAHHRIHQPGHKDYYERLIDENEAYRAPVQLPSGRWASRTDRSKRAKLARHRRYIRRCGNAVYKQRVDGMEAEPPSEGEEGEEDMDEEDDDI